MLSQPSKKFLNQRWEHCMESFLHFNFSFSFHHTLIITTDKNTFNGFTECWFVNKTKMFLNTIENCGVQRGYSMPIPSKWRWRRWNIVGEAAWWASVMKLPPPSKTTVAKSISPTKPLFWWWGHARQISPFPFFIQKANEVKIPPVEY